MTSSWSTTATLIIAVWSALASTFACWIAWRVFRWQRAGDVPAISAMILPCPYGAGLLRFAILLESKSSVGWYVHDATCNNSAIRFANEADCWDQAVDGAGSIDLARFEANARRRQLCLDEEIGTAGSTVHQAARHSIVLLFRVDDDRSPPKVSIRLRMASMEPTQRRRTITITRTLVAVTDVAKS